MTDEKIEEPTVEAAAPAVAEPEYKDIELTCIQCGKKFVFTAGEQKFYATHFDRDGKPFQAPKRCKECRAKHKDDIRKIRDAKHAGKEVKYDGATVTITDAPVADVSATFVAPSVVDCSDVKKA